MVTVTKTAIVNPSLANFTASVFNPSPVYSFMLYGLLYENKSAPGITHTFENNFTTIGTKSFHYCSCLYLFFSATFHEVNVVKIVLLSDIKLEPFISARCAIWHFFKKRKNNWYSGSGSLKSGRTSGWKLLSPSPRRGSG
jgi:hypothetical protein